MDDLVVEVEQGLVRGKLSRNYKNGIFYSFYGIPYAQPPVANLRFKEPQPPKPWIGTLDATIEKDGCISRNIYTGKLEGSEDCLHLNVYTPQVKLNGSHSSNLYPVIAFVHGGSFMVGNAKTELYGPDFLLTQDVVLVTLCYRFAAFGFSCLQEGSLGLPGNHGIRDVIMALKWVQKNIGNFSGDPDNVTLFGHSSGAGIAHFIMLSPLGEGLFHKVILHGGCGFAEWAKGRKDSLKKLAKTLGLVSDNDKEIYEFMMKQPAEVISEVRRLIASKEDPKWIVANGQYNKVPLLIGYTSDGGMIFEREMRRFARERSGITDDFESFVPHSLGLVKGCVESLAVAEKINSFYFGGEYTTEELKKRFFQLQRDTFYVHPIQTAIRYHLKTMSSPIYLFKFAFDGKLNLHKKLQGGNLPGASHGDELCYLFKMSKNPEVEDNSAEDLTIRRMVKMWCNFARTGNPTPEKTDNILVTKWKPVEENKLNYLHIDRDLIAGVDPDKDCVDFWDRIYDGAKSLCKL